jgi:tryptophanyl-tRNA synthetase
VTAGESHTDQQAAVQAVADGPFTTRQLLRLDDALAVADRSTGLTFSVYVGALDEPVRQAAENLHARLADPAHSVLVAVSPDQRQLEIVTGEIARKRVSDRDSKLAALSMAASFGGGDLAGGLVSGLAQLADHAGRS